MKELEEALNKVRALKNPTGPSPADVLLRKWKMRELGDRVGKAIEKMENENLAPPDDNIRYLLEENRLIRNSDRTYTPVKSLIDVIDYYMFNGQEISPKYIQKYFRNENGNPYTYGGIRNALCKVKDRYRERYPLNEKKSHSKRMKYK